MAASVASGWLVAAMPCLPTAGERVTNDFSVGRSTAIVRSLVSAMVMTASKAAPMCFNKRCKLHLWFVSFHAAGLG